MLCWHFALFVRFSKKNLSNIVLLVCICQGDSVCFLWRKYLANILLLPSFLAISSEIYKRKPLIQNRKSRDLQNFRAFHHKPVKFFSIISKDSNCIYFQLQSILIFLDFKRKNIIIEFLH